MVAAGRASSSEIKKPLIYQIGEYVHINATGERPLLQAIDALQQKYGWVIDYEDPQYLVAPGSSRNLASPVHRLHAMATSANANGFSVQFQVPANVPPDEVTVLSTIVDAYNQSGGPGRFQLVKESKRLDVVGVAAINAQGESVTQQPVLDSRITVASRPRSVDAAVAAICEKVSQAAKVRISTDEAEHNARTSISLSGSPATARSLLSQVLSAIGSKFYWRLTYDSGVKSYRLTIGSPSQ